MFEPVPLSLLILILYGYMAYAHSLIYDLGVFYFKFNEQDSYHFFPMVLL